MTVGEWVAYAESRLASAGIEAARLEAQVLASHVLLMDRSALLAHPEEFPEFAGEVLLQLREKHEPLAYIVGRREFYGRSFVVSPSVLIPRHETETLIEAALSFGLDSARVLDVGVGSGAIALTLKLERPSWSVTGVDVSHDALTVAAENAALLDVDVRLLQSDLFSAVAGETFDLIVSNPPYIGETEKNLSREVREYEPAVALFSGPTGLEFYERLAASAAGYLSPAGRLIVEIGYLQSSVVPDLFTAQGWTVVRTVNDLTGIVRVVELATAPS